MWKRGAASAESTGGRQEPIKLTAPKSSQPWKALKTTPLPSTSLHSPHSPTPVFIKVDPGTEAKSLLNFTQQDGLTRQAWWNMPLVTAFGNQGQVGFL